MTAGQHEEATAIHAVPAAMLARSFTILVLRQFEEAGAPPAFAFIEQHILRAPQRNARHGMFFSATFLPEIMAWLGARLGRPSLRDGAGTPRRNPRWPVINWSGEGQLWPDGTRTIEWRAEIAFAEDETSLLFGQAWRERLEGRMEPDCGAG